MNTTSTPSDSTTIACEDRTPRMIAVVAYPDAIVEAAAGSIPTASDEALIWWTPSVGPTAMLMAHRFATYAAEGPTSWSLADLAQTFGAGKSGSRILHTARPAGPVRDRRPPRRHRRDPAVAPAVDRPPAGPAARVPGLRLPALMCPEWMASAACRGMSPARFYPPPDQPADDALSVCAGCPVRVECDEHATVTGEDPRDLGRPTRDRPPIPPHPPTPGAAGLDRHRWSPMTTWPSSSSTSTRPSPPPVSCATRLGVSVPTAYKVLGRARRLGLIEQRGRNLYPARSR